MLSALLYTLIVLTSLFLICLVLIQRGRGGGLAGAFGGAGGSSAFGTRAGDVFTRITIVTVAIWIGLNMLLVILTNENRETGPSAFAAPTSDDDGLPGLPLDANQGTGGDTKGASGTGGDAGPSPLSGIPGLGGGPAVPAPLQPAPAAPVGEPATPTPAPAPTP